MRLCYWPGCPNFSYAAGFFTLGGSGFLHVHPSFVMATFLLLLLSSKDERVEAPRGNGRCRKCMDDRLDCMAALDYGRLASRRLHAIVGLRFLGARDVGSVLVIILRNDSHVPVSVSPMGGE